MNLDGLKGIIHSDPEIMAGVPVFIGTRVPLQNLIDSLEGGDSIDDFLAGYPSVRLEQVIAVIEAHLSKLSRERPPVGDVTSQPVAWSADCFAPLTGAKLKEWGIDQD